MKTERRLLLWSGAALLAAMAATPAHADEKGEKLLKEAFKTLHEAKAMTANLTITLEGEDLPNKKITFKGTIAAMKPNFLRVEYKGEVKMGEKTITLSGAYVADGKDYWILGGQRFGYMPVRYMKDKLAEKPTEFLGEWEGEIDSFFGGEKNVEKVIPKAEGTEKVGMVMCDVVKVTVKPTTPDMPERTITYFIGQKDHLIYRGSYKIPTGGGSELTQTNTLSDINLKAAKKEEDFKFTPPKDAKLFEPPQKSDVSRRQAPQKTLRAARTSPLRRG